MTRSIALLALSLFAFSASTGLAQNSQSYLNDVGSPAYSVNIPVENGFINVSNGNLHLEFPLASPPQRGALNVSERLVYDSRIWMFSPFGTHGSYHWWPYNVPGTYNLPGPVSTSGGWRLIKSNEVGTIGYPNTSENTTPCGYMGDGSVDDSTRSNLSWTDPSGTVHNFNAVEVTDNNECSGAYNDDILGGNANDGSGYSIPSDPNGNISVIDGNGAQVYPFIADRFGNYLSADGNGNLVDDTGRTPVIATTNGNVTYYDVLAPNGKIQNNGTRVRYTVTSASVPVSTTFLPWSQSDIYPWNPSTNYLTPVQSIGLPDGSQYSFTYDRNGEVSSVTLPTGGVVQYGYTDFVDSANTENNWLTSRTMSGSPSMTFKPMVGTQCANYSTGCIEYVIAQRPSTDSTIYEFTLANGAWNTGTYSYTGPVPVFTSGQIPKGQGGIKPLVFNTSTYQYSNACSGVNCTGANYVTSSLATTLLYANGSPYVYTQAQSAFDPVTGKPTFVKEWDYSNQVGSMSTTTPPSSLPYRETDYSYTGFDPYQVTVLDSSGHQAGQTTYTYTASATAKSGIPGHGTQNAGGPYLYSVAHWLNTGQPSPKTLYSFDDTGMISSIQDPNSHLTSISYECSNSLPSGSQSALPQVFSQSTYDCSSGALISAQDANDVAAGRGGTVYAYEPTAGRPYTVTRPDGGVTTYSYPSPLEADSTMTAAPDPTVTSKTILDTFGRPSTSITGGVETDTTYDVNGRVNCTTNPYTTSPTGSTCITAYDGLDRPLTQVMSDGVSTRTWSYFANSITSTDERGISWTRTTDPFGKLRGVAEPGPSGTIATAYSYDGLSNLVRVTQSGISANGEGPHIRTFTYDSLAHLVCASNPETAQNYCPASATTPNPAGVVAYTYDLAGNLHTKTDARNITTTFTYDPLNRLTLKQYNDGTTPSVNLTYDQTGMWSSQPCSGSSALGQYAQCNMIGRLSSAGGGSNSANTTYSIFGYDAMGRPTMQATCITTNCGNGQYYEYAGYDVAGNMTDLIYPSTRHIIQTFDAAGRLNTSNLVALNGVPLSQSYLQSIGYYPDGSPGTVTLGNGVVQQINKDSSLRVQSITATTPLPPVSNQPLLSHTYCYVNCPTGGTANNGTIWGITDNLNGSRNQGFAYDSLNRISQFWLNGTLAQQYQTDSFGNLSGMVNGSPTTTFDPWSNRISNLPCASSTGPNSVPSTPNGPFDQAGNQVCDSDQNGLVRIYTYDAENRMTQINSLGMATTATQPPLASYVYAADGNRVQKTLSSAPFDPTQYLYFGGQAIAEKNSIGWTDYIFSNGQRIARVAPMAPMMHAHGLRDGSNMSCGQNWWLNVGSLGGYTVQSGDVVQFDQKSIVAHGGLAFHFSGGSWMSWGRPVDQFGYSANDFYGDGYWHHRSFALDSSYNGQSIDGIVSTTESDTPVGTWDTWIQNVSVLRANGDVVQIFTGQQVGSTSWGTCDKNISFGVETTTAMIPQSGQPLPPSDQPSFLTTFFLADHLGSTQMELSGSGVPTALTQFGPFGAELDTQATASHYKFTGFERDGESGLDHATFRQYASYTGRWMSADPYDGSMDVNDPQTLNRYGYVGNMPLSLTDPSGLMPLGCGFGASMNDGVLSVGFGVGISTFAAYAGAAACAARVIEDLFHVLFSRPKFTESHTARPGAIWDEHGSYKVRPYSGIGDILGTSGGCEFGACNFQQGANGGGSLSTPTWLQRLQEIALGIDWRDPNGRLFGTHYCGQGGSGGWSQKNFRLNLACAAHDTCYDNAKLSYGDNFSVLLSFSKGEALRSCNQNLCRQAAAIGGSDANNVRDFFTYGGGGFYGCK